MKKNIIALVIVFIVVTFMTACAKPNTVVRNIVEPATVKSTYVKNVPKETVEDREPWLFNVSYVRDGKRIEKDLTTELFGEKIQIAADSETTICVGICSYKDQEFYLTETFFIVKEDSEIVNIVSDEHMGNLWWHMEAGQSAVITMNYGTEDEPEWVSFSVETIVE